MCIFLPFLSWSCIPGGISEGGVREKDDGKWKPCFPLMISYCAKDTCTFKQKTFGKELCTLDTFTLKSYDRFLLDIIIHNTFHWKRFVIGGKPWHNS